MFISLVVFNYVTSALQWDPSHRLTIAMYVPNILCYLALPDRLHYKLFDFVDLRGFSVYLKPGFFESHGDMFLDGAQFLILLGYMLTR